MQTVKIAFILDRWVSLYSWGLGQSTPFEPFRRNHGTGPSRRVYLWRTVMQPRRCIVDCGARAYFVHHVRRRQISTFWIPCSILSPQLLSTPSHMRRFSLRFVFVFVPLKYTLFLRFSCARCRKGSCYDKRTRGSTS